MKRDMNLIRKILFKLEEEFESGDGLKSDLKIDGYEYLTVGEHCQLLYEANLIRDFIASRGAENKLLFFKIGALSNKGHDYLELIRDDKVWEQTSNEVNEKKLPQTIQTIGTVAASIAGAFMREYNR